VKSKWALAVIVGLVALAVYAASVLATPATPPAFSGTPLAKATYGEIDSHVVAEPGWQEKIKTQGSSDLYVQQNTWDPGLCGGCTPSTGWHTHPGPSFIVVTQGSVTVYDGDDPTCSPHVYTANTANNAFVDAGGGHDHVIRNESGSVAKTIAVQLIPAGADRRQDSPAPGNCSF
jgi:hypothetical protein